MALVETPSFTLSFPMTFWSHFHVHRALQHRLWSTWVGYAFFAGVPTYAFIMAFVHHWDLSRRGTFGLPGWAAFVASYMFIFAFLPLLQMIQLWAASRRNRTLFGMQHVALTAEGVSSRGESFNTTLGWDAIHKAVETRRYFFLFFSARGAGFIPKEYIRSESEMTQLRSVLRHYLHDKAHLSSSA